MPRKIAEPRSHTFMGSTSTPQLGEEGTWLEPESFAYPNGAKARRCLAKHATTGEFVVVKCGIPDTYFSIPCAGGGYVTSKDGTFVFHPKG